jgi:alanine racemase
MVGYGTTPAPPGKTLVVARCGYGDGFPRGLVGTADILSIGMQYTVIARPRTATESMLELVGAATDLDEMSERAGLNPHQFIVGIGLGRRVSSATDPNRVAHVPTTRTK